MTCKGHLRNNPFFLCFPHSSCGTRAPGGTSSPSGSLKSRMAQQQCCVGITLAGLGLVLPFSFWALNAHILSLEFKGLDHLAFLPCHSWERE